jgi:hypothetical protein
VMRIAFNVGLFECLLSDPRDGAARCKTHVRGECS